MNFNPRAFTSLWLKKKGISIDERGALISKDKRDFYDIFDTLFLDYLEMARDYNKIAEKGAKVVPVAEKDMLKALNEMISLEMLHRREEIIARLICEREDLVPIEKFVSAIIGTKEDRVVALMAHFIWMIKRRLNDKDVVYHIMPIIFGKQGAGKSVAVERLLSPLSNLTLRIRVTELTDPRFFFSLNKNFVAFLDEMAGASKADVEVLKNQVTARFNDARKLNTNIVTKLKQNCSLIGCTNRPVGELIYDTTGSRRFYELRSLDKIDWGAINTIDFLALYKGIDENKERGYIEPYLDQIVKDQEAITAIDELTAFIEQNALLEPGTQKEISCSNLYEVYKMWVENNGAKQLSSVQVGRKLGFRGIKSSVRKIGHKSERYYMIQENSPVHRKSLIGDPLAAKTGKEVRA